MPSFDISPRDKWERQAYTRTFAKEVYNIKRLESIGLVELFGEYSSFGDRLLLSENMFAELTDNGLLFADVGSGLFKDTIQPQENFEKQSG